MKFTPIYLESEESQRLISSGNSDATLLYLYLRNGNDLSLTGKDLQWDDYRFQEALQTLRSIGLYKRPAQQLERPRYTEQDLLSRLHSDMDFQSLCKEVQHRTGKALNAEELKVLLSISNYLGLPNDVICVLISYCTTRARQKGLLKPPTLFQIEKEAYRWSDEGIDNLEAAFAHIHKLNEQNDKLTQLAQLLQIRGRKLTAPEEKYAQEWLQWNMSDELIRAAYEKTCVNTGGLNWAYMHKILASWKEAGYRSPADVRSNGRQPVPKGASGKLGEAELEAIQKIMSMDVDDFLSNTPNNAKRNYL